MQCTVRISYRLITKTLFSWQDVISVALTDSLCLADISIFTLKEVQMQRDPGYRNSSYPESGEESFFYSETEVYKLRCLSPGVFRGVEWWGA